MNRRFPIAPLLSALCLGGFGACTFGADDFTIIVDDDDDGDAGSDGSGEGGSSNGAQGSGATGTEAGSETGGSGATGEGGAGGSAEPAPTFTCDALGPVIPIFSQADFEGRTPDDGPFLATNGDNVMIVVPTSSGANDSDTRLYMRPLRDSNGGTVDSISTFDTVGGRLRVGTVTFVDQQLKIFGSLDNEITEFDFPTQNDGTQLGTVDITSFAGPAACSAAGAHVRDLKASYANNELSYVVTCGEQSQESFSLHLATGAPPTPVEIAPAGADDINNIVRGYARLGQHHFMQVGAEVGPLLAMRHGETVDELQSTHNYSLNADANVWSSVLVRPMPTGVFLYGAAFTTDPDPNATPPLVPAEMYAGSVGVGALGELFTDADGGNIPPAPLKLVATYDKASELVGFDDALPLGPNVLVAGASVLPRNRIHVSYLSTDGTVLAPPTQIYATQGGATITDHSVHLARLGLGMAVVWMEDGAVYARAIACLKD